MVPVFINTCYPPNRPTARRCYDFGIALRKAIETMPGDKRVLIIASGGLSHFVLDEELDRMLIQGLENDDRAVLEQLPRLDSPTGEIRNWVAAAGACSGMRFELFDYVPTPRSAAGTGGGWCFAHWDRSGPGIARADHRYSPARHDRAVRQVPGCAGQRQAVGLVARYRARRRGLRRDDARGGGGQGGARPDVDGVRLDNRFLADTVAQRPATFAGVCSVDALADDVPDS